MNNASPNGMMLSGESGTNLPNQNPMVESGDNSMPQINTPEMTVTPDRPQINTPEMTVTMDRPHFNTPEMTVTPTHAVQRAHQARQAAQVADAHAQEAEKAAKQAVASAGNPPTLGVGSEGDYVNNDSAVNKLPLSGQNDLNQSAQAPDPKNSPNPAVRKASWLHDVAEVLGGGPRYSYSVDVNTGKMTKTKVPVSGKQLGLAIALEAISGFGTGLAAGRGHGAGAAATASFGQGYQRGLDRDARARGQANADYQRQAAVAQSNMRMAMNQRNLSQSDYAMQQHGVDVYAPVYAEAEKSGALDGRVVGEDELNNLLKKGDAHITRDNAIPVGVVPKYNADGTRAKGANGEELWDTQYALIKPDAELNYPPETLKYIQDHKVPGYVNPTTGEPLPLPADVKQRIHRIVDATEQARASHFVDQSAQGLYNGYLNTLHSGTAKPGTPNAPNGPKKRMPTFGEFLVDESGKPNFEKAADAITKQEGGPTNVNHRNNNPGNIIDGNWAKSQPGYAGVGEKGFAKFNTPEDGRKALITKLSQDASKYGDLTLDDYINQHYSPDNAPGNKPGDARKYAFNLLNNSGKPFDEEQTANDQTAAAIQPRMSKEDFDKALSELSPAARKAVNKLGGFDAFYTGKQGELSKAEQMALVDKTGDLSPQAVGEAKAFAEKILPVDEERAARNQSTLEQKALIKQQQEDAKKGEQDKLEEDAANMLRPPDNFQYDSNILNMSPKDAASALRAKGVQVPANFADLFTMAKNDSSVEGLTPRVYKGVGGVLGMNRTMGRSYIEQFLNPNWKEEDYKGKQKFIADMTPGGKLGQIVYNAGVASQHLDLAEKLFDNIDNTKSPAFNDIANKLGVKVFGEAPPAVYKTVADVLANEVAKVAGGTGGVHQTEVDKFAQDLANSQSPEQAKQNLKALIGLMSPRINDLFEQADNYKLSDFQKKLPHTLVEVFGKHGQFVPGYGYPFYSPSTGQLWFSKDGNKENAQRFN